MPRQSFASRGQVALLEDVAQANLYRIDAKLPASLVHEALDGEGDLVDAVAAEGTPERIVGESGAATNPTGGNSVRSTGEDAPLLEHLVALPRVRPGIVEQVGVDSEQVAFAVEAGPVGELRGVPLRARKERLPPLQRDSDGPPEAVGGKGGRGDAG